MKTLHLVLDWDSTANRQFRNNNKSEMDNGVSQMDIGQINHNRKFRKIG